MTKIEYADVTVNDQAGCSLATQGCVNCFARPMSHRLACMGQEKYQGVVKDGMWTGKINLWPQAQDQVLRMKKPRRIFWNDMSDLFHPDVPDSHIDRKMAVIALTPQHFHMIFTKRPERMCEYLRWEDFDPSEKRRDMINVAANEITGTWDEPVPAGRWPIPNLMAFVSASNQEDLARFVPWLFKTPLALRGVSLEPALRAVNLFGGDWRNWLEGWDTELEAIPDGRGGYEQSPVQVQTEKIDGVTLGGESGPGARPMHLDIPRSVRDQCQAAGVPFFFKQWGEWVPFMESRQSDLELAKMRTHRFDDGKVVYWVGKKAAGRLLDGRTWDELPEVIK